MSIADNHPAAVNAFALPDLPGLIEPPARDALAALRTSETVATTPTLLDAVEGITGDRDVPREDA